jgi:hypothetical protein
VVIKSRPVFYCVKCAGVEYKGHILRINGFNRSVVSSVLVNLSLAGREFHNYEACSAKCFQLNAGRQREWGLEELNRQSERACFLSSRKPL